MKNLIHGQSNGTERIWYESGELKFEGEYKFGIALHYTKWDEKGRIIKQKISPTETDLKLIESVLEKRYLMKNLDLNSMKLINEFTDIRMNCYPK